MRHILLHLISIFTFAGSLCAQDSIPETISVKKNRKVLRSLDVFNYPKIRSKEEEGLCTESSKYDEKGNVFLRSNFYNQTNETYAYNSKGLLTSVRVYNTYLKNYMYQDSLTYDEQDHLIQKVRFRFNKLNAGGKDIATRSTKGINYIPDSVLFLEIYKYDVSGKMIYKANQKGKVFSCFTFGYDSAGQQIRERAVSTYLKDSLIVINTTTYDEVGEPVKYVEKNSRDEIFKTTLNKFDTKGNKLETVVYDGSFNMIQKFEFIYDKDGNMIEQDYFDYKYVKEKKESVQSSESKIKYVRKFY